MQLILTAYANCYNNDTVWVQVSALGHSGSKKCVLGFKYDVKPGKNVSKGMIGFVQNDG